MALATRIIPALLYRGANLYKGEKFNAWRQVGVAQQAVQIHQARGVDELIMLDIGATPEGRGPDLAMVERLAANCFSPLTVGGGVRTVDDIGALLNEGADKVCIGTAAFKNPRFIQESSNVFGSQAIVASLDVRNGWLVTDCGTKETHYDPREAAMHYEMYGVGEILLTSIDREGKLQGYDLDLIRAISQAVSIPVIANGGCSGYADMLAAIEAGASAVAAGALFQFTDATPKGAAQFLTQHGVEVRL